MKINFYFKLIILYISISVDFVNGFSCFDGSSSDNDCECSTLTGAMGTCNCGTSGSVRHGQPCAYDLVKSIDSVCLKMFFHYRIYSEISPWSYF